MMVSINSVIKILPEHLAKKWQYNEALGYIPERIGYERQLFQWLRCNCGTKGKDWDNTVVQAKTGPMFMIAIRSADHAVLFKLTWGDVLIPVSIVIKKPLTMLDVASQSV